MATFDSIAEEYTLKIKNSAKKTSLEKSASLKIESIQKDTLVLTLKEINEDIKNYSIEGKPLSETQKQDIFRRVGNKLGLSEPDKVYLMLKEASNDNFVALANYWSNFIDEIEL